MNQRNGTFCDAAAQAGPALQIPRVSRGLAVADLDNDGNMDVVIDDLDGEPMILHNNGIPGKHWVSFELAGTKSNRLAIGARLKTGRRRHDADRRNPQRRQLSLQPRFPRALRPRQTRPRSTRWKSGGPPARSDKLTNLKADKFYSVLEGSGIVERDKIVPKKK